MSISYEEAQSMVVNLEQAINNGNELEAIKIAEAMASLLVNIEILVYDTPDVQTINNPPRYNPNFPVTGNQPTIANLNPMNPVNLPLGSAMNCNPGYQQNFVQPQPYQMLNPRPLAFGQGPQPPQMMPGPIGGVGNVPTGNYVNIPPGQPGNYANAPAGPVVYGNLPQHFIRK
ncbi:hypothetical protein SteCoe_13281 [Stentor coeruleus]|uniref:Uncharacterized protein n=1 Tax=Stentor coeruleus TaxID=5963 RepID=A0A1R2C8U4_9CILI|nr:hypothetical protein SteCoe_13281 [Stentor coeruleus]